MPNGKSRNLYLPNKLLNVHNLELASSNFSCQNPEDASSLLKYLALANCDIISSRVGSLKCSLCIVRLRSFGYIDSELSILFVNNNKGTHTFSWFINLFDDV